MTTKGEMKEGTGTVEVKAMTFRCRFCNEVKPYSEMVILPRYFPPLVACQGCSVKVEYAPKEEQSQEA